MIYNEYICRNCVVENQIQYTTHMNFKTVTKEQMTLDSNSTDKGKYVQDFV